MKRLFIFVPMLFLISGCFTIPVYEEYNNDSNSTWENLTTYLYNDTANIHSNGTYFNECCYPNDCPQAENNPEKCTCIYVTEYVEGEVDCKRVD